MVATPLPTPGLFGKLPSHGDFVSRELSPALCDGLDRLMQAALGSALREGATRDSLERSATAFSLNLRPGAVASTGFFGCVVPSCDRVGRFFPLCVGLETPGPGRGAVGRLPLAWPSLGLTVQICQTLYDQQAAGGSPDAILAALPDPARWEALTAQQVPFDNAGDLTVPPMSPTTVQFAFQGPEPAMRGSDAALCAQLPMLAEALGGFVTAPSGFDLFFATRSLLSWSPLAAWFDQRWSHWGWALQPLPEQDDDATLVPDLNDDAGTASA